MVVFNLADQVRETIQQTLHHCWSAARTRSAPDRPWPLGRDRGSRSARTYPAQAAAGWRRAAGGSARQWAWPASVQRQPGGDGAGQQPAPQRRRHGDLGGLAAGAEVPDLPAALRGPRGAGRRRG